MTLYRSIFIFMMAFVVVNPSWGRVFRINNESTAAYFGGSYGTSALQQTHFADTSGSGVTIDKSFTKNLGGEFGILWKAGQLGIRLGIELINPGTMKDAIGVNAGGTTLYDFEANISALIPKAALEFTMSAENAWRAFLILGGGSATVNYSNSYVLNTAGQAAFPGIADFADEGVGTGRLLEAGLGIEGLMNDTTTVALSIVSRQLVVPTYKYKSAGTNFIGTHAAGDEILDGSGTYISSSFSGLVANLLFRFYLK